MKPNLQREAENWDRLGAEDPLWAILTHPAKRGKRWDLREFLATGEQEVRDLMDELERHAPPTNRRLALDFGCGVGRLSRCLAAHFERVLGVDIAASMIARARELNRDRPGCEFIHNTAADLGCIGTATVDFVYSSITLQHIPTAATPLYLGEFVRVLAPGGTACFNMPTGPDFSLRGWVFRLVPNAVLNPFRRVVYRTKSVMEMHALPERSVRRIVAQAGGTVVLARAFTGKGYGWRTSRYFVRRREDQEASRS